MIKVIVATSILLLGSAPHGASQTRNPQVVNIKAMRALWSNIKKQLTAPDGEEYFRLNLENADIPRLMGTLVSATPGQHPSTLVLAISDPSTPEVTVHLKNGNGQDDHLNGPLLLGSEVQFQGVPVAFTRNPFMLTFEALITSAAR